MRRTRSTTPSRRSQSKSKERSNEEKEQGNVYIVEKIIGKRINNGQELYRCRWRGYSPNQDTWEPKINLLDNCQDLIDLYEASTEKYPSMKHEKIPPKHSMKSIQPPIPPPLQKPTRSADKSPFSPSPFSRKEDRKSVINEHLLQKRTRTPKNKSPSGSLSQPTKLRKLSPRISSKNKTPEKPLAVKSKMQIQNVIEYSDDSDDNDDNDDSSDSSDNDSDYDQLAPSISQTRFPKSNSIDERTAVRTKPYVPSIPLISPHESSHNHNHSAFSGKNVDHSSIPPRISQPQKLIQNLISPTHANNTDHKINHNNTNNNNNNNNHNNNTNNSNKHPSYNNINNNNNNYITLPNNNANSGYQIPISKLPQTQKAAPIMISFPQSVTSKVSPRSHSPSHFKSIPSPTHTPSRSDDIVIDINDDVEILTDHHQHQNYSMNKNNIPNVKSMKSSTPQIIIKGLHPDIKYIYPNGEGDSNNYCSDDINPYCSSSVYIPKITEFNRLSLSSPTSSATRDMDHSTNLRQWSNMMDQLRFDKLDMRELLFAQQKLLSMLTNVSNTIDLKLSHGGDIRTFS